MKKRLEIARQANLPEEAYTLLFYWINFGDIDKDREKFAEHYSADIDDFNQKYDLISEMFHYVVDHLKTDKERLDYYFKLRSSGYATFAALALVWDYRNLNGELQSFKDRMNSITAERRIKEYAMIISGEEAAQIPDKELSTLADLIGVIEASPFDMASKWEAIKIYNNQEKYYNEVNLILGEVIELLKSKFSVQLEGLARDFYEYWTAYQESTDIVEKMNEILKVSWRMSDKGSILEPSIFLPLSFSVSLDDIENRSQDIIHFGILLDSRYELLNQKLKNEDIVEIGKILSDKSKVDILELVSKKTCYGKEIANELNLSTATISYHVNALLKVGFLKADVISNKVYYSINRERISASLEDVKGHFTELNT